MTGDNATFDICGGRVTRTDNTRIDEYNFFSSYFFIGKNYIVNPPNVMRHCKKTKSNKKWKI